MTTRWSSGETLLVVVLGVGVVDHNWWRGFLAVCVHDRCIQGMVAFACSFYWLQDFDNPSKGLY